MMKTYRKKGVIHAVKFNKKAYEELVNDEKKLSKQSNELRILLKRIKRTQNNYFCAASAGMRPISDGSWLCFDTGRVFTMSDRDFVGKFEEFSDELKASDNAENEVTDLLVEIGKKDLEIFEMGESIKRKDTEFDKLSKQNEDAKQDKITSKPK